MKIEQQNPDFVYNKEDQKNYVRECFNTRYNYFRQNYYTAGDLEQFLERWKNLPRDAEKNNKCIQSYGTIPISFENKLCIHDYFNTFQYINEKFKKGCFLQFHSNELETFIPFSKQNFKNEWGDKIEIDPKFKTISNLMKYLSEFDSTFPFDEKRIHRDVHSWYGNNGLVRFEFPLSESDNGYNMLKDMFITLTKERDIPDVDFFLNKRDFPILRNDGIESYDCFFGKNQPLLSHSYKKYVPILSMNTTDKHMDIPIPTWDDWRFISYLHDGKMFGKEFQKYPSLEEFDSIQWEDKIPTIIWRGASTGRGTTVKDNIRLFYYQYSEKKEKDQDGHLFIDLEFTKWNLRPRKHPDNRYIRTILKEDFDMRIGSYMTPLEQANYKYCINLPGHSCAYRLSCQLFSGSLVLSYPCENKLWFFDMLEPYVHYIPIEKEFSIDDLKEKIRWCKENDEKCKEIVKNARKFAEKYLSRDGILDYLQKVLCSIAEKNSILYKKETLHEEQLKKINERLSQYKHSMKQLSPDFFRSNIYIREKQYMNYYISFLQDTNLIDDFLEKTLIKENIVHSKKTHINLYEKNDIQWIEKIISHNWKRDDLHQIFIGYFFTNNLAKICPHFIHTYGHTEEEKNTKIYLEYKPYSTLDKEIRDNSISFKNLVNLWVNLCAGLQIAQDYCGFMHMDLYPWNILVQKKKRRIIYPELGMETNFNICPIMIDYGNSHVSDSGFHYYNTTPFQLHSFTDVICMVICSLDVFLSKVTLSGHDIKKLFIILRFLYEDSEIPIEFISIHQVKQFIKVNKKFSKMLCSSSSIQQKRPLDFIYFLYQNQCIEKNEIIFFKNKIQKYNCLYYPNIFQLFFHELDIFRSIINEEEYQKLGIDNLFTLYRRVFIHFKKVLNMIKYKSSIQETYISYIIHHFIMEYRKGIEQLQEKFKRKIWLNHNINHVLDILHEYPKRNIESKELFEIENIKKSSDTIPLLKTHNCITSNDCSTTVSNVFFDKVQLIYLLGGDMRNKYNFFILRNQNK